VSGWTFHCSKRVTIYAKDTKEEIISFPWKWGQVRVYYARPPEVRIG
jgi:hypothetical protein